MKFVKKVKIMDIEFDLFKIDNKYRVYYNQIAHVAKPAKTQKQAIANAVERCEKKGKAYLIEAIDTFEKCENAKKFREENAGKFYEFFKIFPPTTYSGAFAIQYFEKELEKTNMYFRSLNKSDDYSMSEAIEKVYGKEASELVRKFIKL